MKNLPDKLFGLTVDRVYDEDDPQLLTNIVGKLALIRQNHPAAKPVVRIVFDFDSEEFRKNRYQYNRSDFIAEAKAYRPAIEKIREQAFVMGEIVDSSEVFLCHYDPRETAVYVERMRAYVEILGDLVDIWEVGNEINGEWVGWGGSAWRDPNITIQQMTATRTRVKNEIAGALGALKAIKPSAVTAVTYYFNDDDDGKHSWTEDKKVNLQTGKLESFGHEYGMMKWAEECRAMFADVNYIFISYYQDDNYAGEGAARAPIIPDRSRWAEIFRKLHGWYPQARLGFGEAGPQCYYLKKDPHCVLHEDNDSWEELPSAKKCEDRACSCCKAAQRNYVTQYYQDWDTEIRTALGADSSFYVGGYFYWHFRPDGLNTPETVKAFQVAFDKWHQ